MCVFFCGSAPGCQKYRILRCLGRPGCPQKAKIFSVAGAPLQKKIDFRVRYVCLFVPVLRAKTTISKSMCVFVCNPCVCFVQSVCVFVCNPCVCLWPIFHRKLRGFRACLKHCKGGHFRRVFTFKMTCSIRVCVLGGHSARILRGKSNLISARRNGTRDLGDTPCVREPFRPIFNGRNGPR